MRRRGFTLIELMISIAILAIVFAASTGSWHMAQTWLVDEMDRSRAAQMLANAADMVAAAPYGQVQSGEIAATDGEARHVNSDGLVPLDNIPVVRLLGVDGLGPRGLTTVTGATLEGDAVRLPRELAGHPVRVRYVGRYRVMATAVEVDAALAPTARAGAGRVVTLQVLDRDIPIPSLTVTVLRMKP